MKTAFSFHRTALLLAFVLVGLRLEAGDKPTISVAKTEASGVAAWQPAMGEGLAQMMITELSGLPNFKVLESVALDDLRAERQLGDSGEVAASESVKKGQWKGADYTFRPPSRALEARRTHTGGGAGGLPRVPFLGGGFGVKKTENEVQIDWHAPLTLSRLTRGNRLRRRRPGRWGRVSTSFNFSSWGGGGFNNNREFMDSALGKATMKAIADITSHLRALDLGPGARTLNNQSAAATASAALRNVKGVVKMVDGKEIWVSLGAANGFATGDKVKIYKPVEKKNKKGEVVATVYEPVAEIILKKVQKDKSMGEYIGDAQISEDWSAADSAVDIDNVP